MPFGPTDAPNFYTAMMKDSKDKYAKLFVIYILELKTFQGKHISVTAANEVMIGGKNLVSGSKTIINDILL